ncbi:Gamma-aminobutyraldehyde dehydrogenase [compost metagenome]
MLTHLSIFFRQRSTYFMVELMLVSEMPHGGQKLSGYGKGMSTGGLHRDPVSDVYTLILLYLPSQ